MTRKIEVNGIKVYGYHGCLEEESVVGTLFEVDVVLGFDYSKASESDDLNHTIDYVRVKEIVEEEVKVRAKLIESVIERIANKIQSEFMLESLSLKLKKYNPPIDGNVNYVAVVWEG